MEWLGERNPIQEILGKESGGLGVEGRLEELGGRMVPAKRDRSGQEGLRVALGIWGVSAEGAVAQG